MSNIPCICGCFSKDHVAAGKEPTIYYCRNCGQKPPFWCYNYTPISNLEYLEWLLSK